MLYECKEQILVDKLRLKASENIINIKDLSGITDEIRVAIRELENIRQVFDSVDIPELIEYAIYTEKAAAARLSYLIQLAKKGA